MNHELFLEQLAKDGFPLPVMVSCEPSGFIEQRSYPFEVKALVLEGQIDFLISGQRTIYLPGDVFHLSENQLHTESYGSKGVKYLVSRKSLSAHSGLSESKLDIHT